jgi:hypothetical protein
MAQALIALQAFFPKKRGWTHRCQGDPVDPADVVMPLS